MGRKRRCRLMSQKCHSRPAPQIWWANSRLPVLANWLQQSLPTHSYSIASEASALCFEICLSPAHSPAADPANFEFIRCNHRPSSNRLFENQNFAIYVCYQKSNRHSLEIRQLWCLCLEKLRLLLLHFWFESSYRRRLSLAYRCLSGWRCHRSPWSLNSLALSQPIPQQTWCSQRDHNLWVPTHLSILVLT